MMGNRRKGRELALQLLYEIELGKKDVELNSLLEESSERKAVKDFAGMLLKGTCENLEHIDGMIAECSSNWHLSRMTPVDRNILRIGAYELRYCDTPPAVAIDEAIEIARKFGTQKSASFVNGILDCIKNAVSRET
jgi:N utilization substance protein B